MFTLSLHSPHDIYIYGITVTVMHIMNRLYHRWLLARALSPATSSDGSLDVFNEHRPLPLPTNHTSDHVLHSPYITFCIYAMICMIHDHIDA